MTDCTHDLEFVQRLQSVEDHAKRNEGRIKKLEADHGTLSQLATGLAVMGEQLKTMNTNLTTLTGKVAEIEERPAKRWEAAVAAAIAAIMGGLIGFALSKLGVG